jgi:hypothetical protein
MVEVHYTRFGMPRHLLLTLALPVALAAACGGNNNPSGAGSGCFAVVGNKGTITGSISGLAPYNGIIANGGANRVIGGPVPFFTVGATSVQDGTGVIISGQAVVGTSAIGLSTNGTNAASNSISIQTRSCTAATGTWFASNATGSGSITVSSSSSTGISGTFSATLDPVLGSGTKTITGSFNATF